MSHRSTTVSTIRRAAALLLTASLTAGSPVAAQSVPAEYVRQFFGAVHLGADRMPLADDVGAAWGRLDMSWARHEPARDRYTFERWDRISAAAERHGVRMMPVLSHTAEWASSAPADHPHPRRFPARDGDIDEWRDYVRRVVERYPEVEYWEIWNEPNIDWFLRADENHRTYVDRILIPAAEVIHAHGKKVVGPSYTLEWPFDSWPLRERPARHGHNVASAAADIDRWLGYRDAWKYIDVLSVHYSKGDTEKPMLPHGGTMMPFYDHVYDKWIATGRLEGIWNTEEGLTAEEAGTSGFVALEPWERPPYAQWVPRYFVPVLDWAIRNDWRDRDQYKVFWYHMAGRKNTLRKTNLLEAGRDGDLRVSETGRAMRTLSRLLTADANRVGIHPGAVEVGFGLFATDTTDLAYFEPYRFTRYAFSLDSDIVIAAWLDLPGIEFAPPEATGQIEARVRGIPADADVRVSRVHYVTGEETLITEVDRAADGALRIHVPRTDDPILYLRIRRR